MNKPFKDGWAQRVRRCQERHPEEGQCELREGHYDALKGKHLAGTAIWGEEFELTDRIPRLLRRLNGDQFISVNVQELQVLLDIIAGKEKGKWIFRTDTGKKL